MSINERARLLWCYSSVDVTNHLLNRLAVFAVCALMLFISVSAWSGDRDQHSASHGAHTHGAADLRLVVEGDALQMQLESPAVNLFGFEHQASSNDELLAVKNARLILEAPVRIFTFQGSDCHMLQTQVDTSDVAQDSEEHHEESHHEDEHDDHHSGHSEVTVDYHFNCVPGSGLQSISVALFEHFPGLETIKVNWVSDSGQGESILKPNANKILFK